MYVMTLEERWEFMVTLGVQMAETYVTNNPRPGDEKVRWNQIEQAVRDVFRAHSRYRRVPSLEEVLFTAMEHYNDWRSV